MAKEIVSDLLGPTNYWQMLLDCDADFNIMLVISGIWSALTESGSISMLLHLVRIQKAIWI